MARTPNILFIFTDQQRADTMACYGNTQINAPNLNALAAQSFVFENGYVSSPICTPSRSTIMTGLWPHVSGCLKNNIRLDDSVLTIADMLPDEYLTAYHGKWHLGNEVIRQHGFDEWVSIEDQYREYYTDPKYLSAFSDYHHFLIGNEHTPDKESEGSMVFSRGYAAALPEELTKATFLGNQAAKFIHDNLDRPFALYVNIFEPHPPYDGPFNDMYDPASIPVSSAFLKNPPDNASLVHRLRAEESLAGNGFDDKSPTTSDEGYWRALIARYWGMVTLVDKAVGTMMKALEDAGVADNTIVVYSAEHGDQLGEHNIIQKAVFYEQSVKVPMLIRVPWLTDRESRVPGRYSHIDTVPTLLELTGSSVPDYLQGESRVPVLKGETTLENNDVMIDWTGRNLDATERFPDLQSIQDVDHRILISHDGWKLNLGEGDQGELYDMNTDPTESTNLFDDSSHGNRIRDMASRIREWQRNTGDTAHLPKV